MDKIARFSRLVALIQQAPLEPAKWPAVIAAITADLERPRPGCGRGLATAWALLAVERGSQFATKHVLNIEINAAVCDRGHGSGSGDRQRDARRRAGDIRIVCIETAAGIRAPEMDAPRQQAGRQGPSYREVTAIKCGALDRRRRGGDGGE